MTSRQISDNQNADEPATNVRPSNSLFSLMILSSLRIDRCLDRSYSRFNSSILDLLPRQISQQADRESIHAAFIHSAAIFFVLACGTCALFAYRILEPFLRSILWSILAGAFSLPFETSSDVSRAILSEEGRRGVASVNLRIMCASPRSNRRSNDRIRWTILLEQSKISRGYCAPLSRVQFSCRSN